MSTKSEKNSRAKKFDIATELKRVSKNVTENSVKVYIRSSKRLLKLAGLDEFPTTAAWLLKKELLKRFDNLSLEKRRSLGVVAVKLADAYNLKRDKTFPWVERMNKASDQYSEKRGKREWTDKEKLKKPDKGWKDVVRLAKFLMTRNRRFFNRELDKVSRKDLYNMQRALIWALFKAIPLRLTYADLHIGTVDSKHKNIIFKSKNGKSVYKMIIRDHKTAKYRGKLEHSLPRYLSRFLNKFIAASKKLNTHDYLLANRNGTRMTKSGLSKYLTRESAKFFGNNGFSAAMIRVLFATHNREALESQKEVSAKLGHKNAETTFGYSRKN